MHYVDFARYYVWISKSNEKEIISNYADCNISGNRDCSGEDWNNIERIFKEKVKCLKRYISIRKG